MKSARCWVDLGQRLHAYGWLTPKSFPALRHNPDVRMVRHAPALDERRALFKVTGRGDRDPHVREVWFAATIPVWVAVDARLPAGDERYTRERLVRCSGASGARNPIELQVAHDLEIRRHP